MQLPWYAIVNEPEVSSPALLIYPDRVEDNIRRMITVAGGTERLRPHLKTHKLAEITRLQIALGIRKFKCATIAEAEMAATAGAPNVLLAYQPVGPNVFRLRELVLKFSQTSFKALVDDPAALAILSDAFIRSGLTLEVFLDLDCGQHRCGIAPGPEAIELYRAIAAAPGVRLGGLHAYDGHVHDTDPEVRRKACEAAFASVLQLRTDLVNLGLPVPALIAGGTPTFPIHAERWDVECAPGTCVLWDYGYTTKLPDLDFIPAATVFTRVVSRPGPNYLCLDLGHKAIASENPHPRVFFPALPEARALTHSEEHLVIETPKAREFHTGDGLYGIPWHICPTVALHSEAVVVRNQRATDRWRIVARERRITI